MIRYFHLLRHHPKFFIFSIASVFFSAPGQTFLISLFIEDICLQTQISPQIFASTYSISTILASLFLYYMGKLVDEWPIRNILYCNAIFFTSAICLLSASSSIYTIFISIFLMRLFGQGVLTLTATATTIKQFSKDRGTALSLTQLGYPLSEFIFPSVAVFSLLHFGWRFSFLIFAGMILFIYLPITVTSISSYKIKHQSTSSSILGNDKSLKFVLKDRFFPFYLSLSCIPPVLMTAALYFQVMIFESHEWNIRFIALSIFIYALTKFLGTIIIGPIIDRFGVVSPLSILILCIGLATCLISVSGPIYIAYAYYGLYGIGLGFGASTMSYLWALLYGQKHIGEIKGFIGIIRNGGTAIAPISFSWILYFTGISVDQLFLFTGIGILLMSIGPFILSKTDSRLHTSLEI